MKRKVIPFLSVYLIISDNRPKGTVEYTLKSGVNSGFLATSSQYKEYVANGLMGYKQFMFNAFHTMIYDKYTYDFATAANFFKAAGDIEDEVMKAVNEILNSPLTEARNYGKINEKIEVEDFDIPKVRKFIRPADCVRVHDIITLKNDPGVELLLTKEINSNFKITSDGGIGQRVFSKSTTTFETDDPDCIVEVVYDSAMERETITLKLL